jgi:hypothetical protein
VRVSAATWHLDAHARDPFAGGNAVETDAPETFVRPWAAREIALRMLNNLVTAYRRRGDLGAAIAPPTCDSRCPPKNRFAPRNGPSC